MKKASDPPVDPFNINARLEKVIDALLTDFEQSPEIFALKDKLYIVQYVSMFLHRKNSWTPKVEDEPVDTGGSAVRKYAGAFRTNVARAGEAHAPRGRAASARSLTIAHDADTDPDDAAD